MQGVACGDLLDLDQQHLAIAHEETADGTALLGNLAEARRGDTPIVAVSMASPWRVTVKSEMIPSLGK
jgi:hypothetical protein